MLSHYPDTIRLDNLWKSLHSVGTTAQEKEFFEEAISGSLLPVVGQDVWSQDAMIPGTPPVGTTSIVEVLPDLVLTPDPTVGSSRVFIAASTPGAVSTRLPDWIPPRFGRRYNVKLFEDDGMGGLGPPIPTADSIGWLFFGCGIVFCQQSPVTAGKTLPLHLSGYRYTGTRGVLYTGPTGDKTFEFTVPELLPQDIWTISHGLGKKPIPIVRGRITIGGTIGVVDYGEIDWPTNDQVILKFSDPTSGLAVLN